MKITKTLNEDGTFDILFDDNNRKFLMSFGGNGDLYWSVCAHDNELNKEIEFKITKENYFLYECFLELYEKVQNCQVFTVMPLELELCDDIESRERLIKRVARNNESLKRDRMYSELFSNGVICWHSDDEIYDDASLVEIRKNEEDFSLIFKGNALVDDTDFISIRFRNSGSAYIPFNILFMNMYNILNEYNFDCYQMHIEESLYRQKVKKKDN